jgi:hypothetical protein
MILAVLEVPLHPPAGAIDQGGPKACWDGSITASLS